MKKVLYLTNIQVPYRVRFFNALARYCRLTVLYERRKSSNRDQTWAESAEMKYEANYLDGWPVGEEFSFSLRILKYVLASWDGVIFGCFNSPVQQLAMLVMRLLKRPYFLSFDGEPFLEGKGLKGSLKRFLARGAAGYLAAGEESVASIRGVAGSRPVVPYYFSSLTREELERCSKSGGSRGDTVLVVGQYFDYKGLDVALEAARQAPDLTFRFVGMGKRTGLFLEHAGGQLPEHVEFIPFLQKEELEEEYRKAAMVVLPSRQECWGLVINEAAAFGTPIISTWGSGAAVEFLKGDYPQYLARPGDGEELLACIKRLLEDQEKGRYSAYLKEKGRRYCIENCVAAHLALLDGSTDPQYLR